MKKVFFDNSNSDVSDTLKVSALIGPTERKIVALNTDILPILVNLH